MKRTGLLQWGMLPVALWLTCCEATPEIIDYGLVCASTHGNGDQLILLVTADTQDCAADHEGASFDCSVVVEGTTVTIETRFQDGKDPNDSCQGSLQASCEAPISAGAYSVRFAGEDSELLVPDSEQRCFGG